ncbi:MAG: double zinc ribbon domain-containing protein [Deferrisomatales bacterium]|nr:double zinc ribbon domain-containing protein [Deferrisomatales bacterium]
MSRSPGPGPWRVAARGLLHLFLPPLCPLCRECAPRPGQPFCMACGAGLTPLEEPWCTRCGVPFAGSGPSHPCPRCRRDPPPFAQARAWGVYGGPLAAAVQRFKYTGQLTLRRTLEDLARDAWRRHYAGYRFTAVVPVPTHPETLRRRGCDLAALLARAVARSAEVPWHPRALSKRVRTPDLVTLDARSRRTAAARAYAPAQELTGEVLLIDDVITTTATARACAGACRTAGAAEVRVLALARTPAWTGQN